MSRWAVWILACALPPRDLEILIGDLEEERTIRSHSMTPPQVAGWYWSQVARSLPFLLWASIRRGGIPTTVTAAVLACAVQAIVELTTKLMLASLIAHDAVSPAALALLVSIPSLVSVSYVATRIRPGAAIALTGLIVIAVTIQLILKTGGSLSIANQLAALIIAPSAAFAGGVLALRRSGGHTW